MTQHGPQAHEVWTIVLAAGEGTRLKSLTRALHGEDLPKQFAVIQGHRSLLEATLDRSRLWSRLDHDVVVVAKEREQLARAQLRPFRGVDIVAQPKNVGTGPGLLLPLARVLERDPDAIVVVAPSDHYVRDTAPFVESVKRAQAIAREEGAVVLIGAVPDRAETQYGWILRSDSGESHGRVAGFHEKPESEIAEDLFSRGALWNTFMIVAPARKLWELGRKCLPMPTALLEIYRRSIGSSREQEVLQSVYDVMPVADFSKHVLERAEDLRVVPLHECGWSDWGTPKRVIQSLRGSSDLDALIGRLREQSHARKTLRGAARAKPEDRAA